MPISGRGRPSICALCFMDETRKQCIGKAVRFDFELLIKHLCDSKLVLDWNIQTSSRSSLLNGQVKLDSYLIAVAYDVCQQEVGLMA